MKFFPILGAMLVVIVQTIAFLKLWHLMVDIARSQDRFPRDIFFGVTIHYGSMLIIGLFVACGLVAFVTNKPWLKWGSILAGLLVWLGMLWPCFDSRLFAAPSIFALGAVILIIGSGFCVPFFRRRLVLDRDGA